MSKIAITHDQFRTFGGAERVAVEMARTFNAPIYAMRVDDGVVPDDIAVYDLSGGIGKRAMRLHQMTQDMYQMVAWQHVDELHDYDVIIENKTNPWWYVPPTEQTIIRYVHSPPRGPYDQFPRLGGGVVSAGINTAMRTLFRQTLPYADAWLCNSDIVERRAERYLGVDMADTAVVYPPVPTTKFSPDIAPTQGYYVTVSRLSRNKRLPQVVEAFRGTDHELVIAGDGERRDQLDALTADVPNVRLAGYVTEAEKRELLAGARAFIMNAEQEDFGMTPIEAFASGTPVVGVDEGMTGHQIDDGVNGVTFNRGVGSLRAALNRFETDGIEWDDETIAEFADLFSAERFRARLENIVRSTAQDTAVDPKLTERVESREPATDRVAVADGGGGDE